MRAPWRNFVAALSLTNLLFLKGWIELFYGVRHPYFRSDPSFYWVDCAALMLDVVLFAGVFWGAAWLAGRMRNRLARHAVHWIFLAVVLLTVFILFNIVRRRFPALSVRLLAEQVGKAGAVAVVLLLVAALLYLLVRWRSSLVGATSVLLLVFSPFVVITFLQAIWLGLRFTSEVQPDRIALAGPHPARKPAANRVLWFIFDDTDYRLAFPERPAGLALPELDRWREATLFATHAEPPAPYTGRSIPALISGRLIRQATPVGIVKLRVAFGDAGEVADWGSQPHLFARARAAGFNAGVIGWYHPYCRVFRASLTQCSWKPFKAGVSKVPLLKSMREFVRQATPPVVRAGVWDRLGIEDPDWDAQYHIDTYQAILAEAQQAIVDPELDLLLVHWPVPHPPFIYDRNKHDFTLTADRVTGYLDNLVLTDRTLAELRKTLESAGLGEETIILVSSDHPWRDSKLFDGKRDPRVPFLLKLPGQTEAHTYEPAFNTVLTPDLLLALAKGELRTAEQVTDWLDARASAQGSPRRLRQGGAHHKLDSTRLPLQAKTRMID